MIPLPAYDTVRKTMCRFRRIAGAAHPRDIAR
jgi:hypothetical protein